MNIIFHAYNETLPFTAIFNHIILFCCFLLKHMQVVPKWSEQSSYRMWAGIQPECKTTFSWEPVCQAYEIIPSLYFQSNGNPWSNKKLEASSYIRSACEDTWQGSLAAPTSVSLFVPTAITLNFNYLHKHRNLILYFIYSLLKCYWI